MNPTQATSPDVYDRCNANALLFLCPITGYPCEGDLSYLCEDYGVLARLACRHGRRKIHESIWETQKCLTQIVCSIFA